jgi:hypothetical protein
MAAPTPKRIEISLPAFTHWREPFYHSLAQCAASFGNLRTMVGNRSVMSNHAGFFPSWLNRTSRRDGSAPIAE